MGLSVEETNESRGISLHRCFNNTRVCILANRYDADARHATNICLISSIKGRPVYPSHFGRANLGLSQALLLKTRVKCGIDM